MYGDVFHGATNTITSPLSKVPKRWVIFSTIIQSFWWKFGAILDHITVYGVAINNLINSTIQNTKIKKTSKSNTSAQNFAFFFWKDDIFSYL